MKLVWLCNIAPSAVQEKLSGQAAGGLWLDAALRDLRQQGHRIRILCPGSGAAGAVDESCSYATFREGLPYVYLPELEARFSRELEEFQPDVIHIWGTEYGHSLAMVNGAEAAGLLSKVVISIQGLCSVIARHYNEGVPCSEQKRYSFRDLIRRDNLAQQQEKFARRGALEVQALEKVGHVVGRTGWDRACMHKINPEARYYHCGETLRDPFYTDSWRYDRCQKHAIFAPGSGYPVKGFHYLLEAFSQVAREYPDATLSLPGRRFPDKGDLKGRLRATNYQNYLSRLAHDYGVADRIRFLGSMSAEQMKQAYLQANVFVLPSTIENSPNSLGEAMLLGTPCVASDVGGVSTLLRHEREGYVYASSAPYMLAWYIRQIFAMEAGTQALGEAARVHARVIHDPLENKKALLEIYRAVSG